MCGHGVYLWPFDKLIQIILAIKGPSEAECVASSVLTQILWTLLVAQMNQHVSGTRSFALKIIASPTFGSREHNDFAEKYGLSIRK